MRLLFHPDKSPYSKTVVPPGTPPLKQYESVFGDLANAMIFVEKFLGSHMSVGLALLPGVDNPLNTHQLDTFVSRLLHYTTPRVVEEHAIMHDWWTSQARPTFAVKRAKVREEKATARVEAAEAALRMHNEAVTNQRRAAEAAIAAAYPRGPTPRGRDPRESWW